MAGGPRLGVAVAGWLIVLATAGFLLGIVAQQGNGLYPGTLVLLAYPLGSGLALREHWQGRPRGAAVVLGLLLAATVLVFSFGMLFLLGLLVMLAAMLPREAWLTPQRAALAVAIAALVASGPVLTDTIAHVVDPCASVRVEPWGATSGGGAGSLAPGGACQGLRETSMTLDRPVALAALGLAGLAAAGAVAAQGARGAIAAASVPLVAALVAGASSAGGFPLAWVAVGCLAILGYALRRKPEAPGAAPSSAAP